MRETKVEFVGPLNLLNIFRGKFKAEGLDVGLEVLDLASPKNGEYVRRLKRMSMPHVAGVK